MKSISENIQMKAVDPCFAFLLFILRYTTFASFEALDEISKYDFSHESYLRSTFETFVKFHTRPIQTTSIFDSFSFQNVAQVI